MQSTLRVLLQSQLSSGQFPTVVVNDVDGIKSGVHTIATTYLICLILHELRLRGHSHPLSDQIIERGSNFLYNMQYLDPISGVRVWHFNAFYPPDWEETAWSAYLLYELGILDSKSLEPLRDLVLSNETQDSGVGVWIKDPYSTQNAYNNVFDPVVSVSVSGFLSRVFGDRSISTDRFIETSLKTDTPSLYYSDSFRRFFLYLFGAGERPHSLDHDRYRLFHHGRRTDVYYSSSDVWNVANLAFSLV